MPNGRRARTERTPLVVTHEEDGGLTIHDEASGVVLSVIATHPSASGPKGLFVEAYAYASAKSIVTQDASNPRNPRVPVTAYYTAVTMLPHEHGATCAYPCSILSGTLEPIADPVPGPVPPTAEAR